MSLPFNNIC